MFPGLGRGRRGRDAVVRLSEAVSFFLLATARAFFRARSLTSPFSLRFLTQPPRLGSDVLCVVFEAQQPCVRDLS